jgi:hypothetical protein
MKQAASRNTGAGISFDPLRQFSECGFLRKSDDEPGIVMQMA